MLQRFFLLTFLLLPLSAIAQDPIETDGDK